MNAQSKGEQTRHRIIQASLEVFAESGPRGASLRRIALQVGLTEPALYRHFTDKQQLYRSALRHAAGTLAECLAGGVDAAAPATDLLDVGDDLLELMLERPSMAAMTQQLLAFGGDELSADLFRLWSQRCRKLGLENRDSGGLVLLNLLSQCAGFVRAKSGLVSFWGEPHYQQSIEPEQRVQLRWLLRRWMLG
jgi:AcrR family transcriptional regulator